MNICVYGASSDAIDKIYIEEGERFGEELAKRGHTLVFGGGAGGLMGAVARGAFREGGKIIGIAPSFFSADGVLFENCNELIRTTTMRERKQKLEDLSDAFVMTPGGIGTFDEFFEIITLKQLARHSKAIALLNTNGYYDLINQLMRRTADSGFMRQSALNLYKSMDDVKDVLDYLETYVPEEFSVADMKHLGTFREEE